jgi:hypothetical protein
MEYVFYRSILRGNIAIDDVPEHKKEAVRTLLNADEQNQ